MRGVKKISDIYIVFLIYALIGWIYEVIWLMFIVPPYHFVNRGVLFGPFLPIYGFGMLILLAILHNFMKNEHNLNKLPNLIIATTVVNTLIYTTIIEYTTTKIYSPIVYLTNYGLGLLISNIIIVFLVYSISKHNKKIQQMDITIILVFICIWIITTSIEYISHFIMDKFFHVMLWDYTKDFLNINKRVNWDASRNFAIGGTLLLYTVQPQINKLLKKLSNKKKYLICLIIGIPMIIDAIVNLIIK